jgi:hypothetical protein
VIVLAANLGTDDIDKAFAHVVAKTEPLLNALQQRAAAPEKAKK